MTYELNNHMELIVRHILPELIRENNICNCDKCFMDLMALTLNQLPPRYVVTRKGELLTEIDATRMQYRTDVLSAALHAIRIVREHPQHDLD